MLVCKKCGASNPVGGKFCCRCGACLCEDSDLLCPVCRTANNGTNVFCQACGASLNGAEKVATRNEKKDKRKKKGKETETQGGSVYTPTYNQQYMYQRSYPPCYPQVQYVPYQQNVGAVGSSEIILRVKGDEKPEPVEEKPKKASRFKMLLMLILSLALIASLILGFYEVAPNKEGTDATLFKGVDIALGGVAAIGTWTGSYSSFESIIKLYDDYTVFYGLNASEGMGIVPAIIGILFAVMVLDLVIFALFALIRFLCGWGYGKIKKVFLFNAILTFIIMIYVFGICDFLYLGLPDTMSWLKVIAEPMVKGNLYLGFTSFYGMVLFAVANLVVFFISFGTRKR